MEPSIAEARRVRQPAMAPINAHSQSGTAIDRLQGFFLDRYILPDCSGL
jgi:hypothetical protein